MKRLYYALCLILFLLSFSASAQKLPSADEVIARYVQVIGGRAKWAAIRTSEFHAKANLNGVNMDLLVVKISPGKYYESLTNNNNSLINIYNLGKGFKVTNGQSTEIDNKIFLDHYELQSCILPDMHYTRLGYKRTLVGIKAIDGVEYYQVELTSKAGSKNTNYYEKKSGLLKIVEKEGAKSYLTDYKFNKGCSVPYKMIGINKDGSRLTYNVTEWVINKKTDPEIFEIKKPLQKL